ncbi:MAG: RidA family protein [Candidatus Korobacteraceae bacterium]
MREVISTDQAPKAIGPYSQAIKAGGFVFVAGQIAVDPASSQLVQGDVRVQTEQVLKNMSAILAAAGTNLEKSVKTTVYLKNMADFAAMNEVYSQFFTVNPPARSTVEVSQLPRNMLVEMDVVALA